MSLNLTQNVDQLLSPRVTYTSLYAPSKSNTQIDKSTLLWQQLGSSEINIKDEENG